MGVKAIRIYSTDRDGKSRCTTVANGDQWEDKLYCVVNEISAQICDSGKIRVTVYGWNHIEHLDNFELPQPVEAQQEAAKIFDTVPDDIF